MSSQQNKKVKGLIAVALLLVALGYAGWFVYSLVGDTGTGAATRKTTRTEPKLAVEAVKPDPVSKRSPMPASVSTLPGVENLTPLPDRQMDAATRGTNAVDSDLEKALTEQQSAALAASVEEAKAKLEKAKADAQIARSRAALEEVRNNAERAYIEANPSRWYREQKGAGAAGPEGPLPVLGAPPSTAFPGNSFGQSEGASPVLRLIVGSGQVRSAYVDYSGSSYHVKAGDRVGPWSVRAVSNNDVTLSKGNEMVTLTFPMPASVPIDFSPPKNQNAQGGSATPVVAKPGDSSTPIRQ